MKYFVQTSYQPCGGKKVIKRSPNYDTLKDALAFFSSCVLCAGYDEILLKSGDITICSYKNPNETSS